MVHGEPAWQCSFMCQRPRSIQRLSLAMWLMKHRYWVQHYVNKIHHAKCVHVFSVMSNLAAPWTVAHQAPLSLGFSRQGYCSRLPFPTPGDLPDPGIEPTSPMFPVLACWVLCTSTTWEALIYVLIYDIFLFFTYFTLYNSL